MDSLTLFELQQYPGRDATERALARWREQQPSGPARLAPTTPSAPGPGLARAVPRAVDVSRFPGRDRTERVMAWLRATTPDAECWADEALRAEAERLQRAARFSG